MHILHSPRIAIKKSQTQAKDNTFSSRLNSNSLPHSASNDLVYKVTGFHRWMTLTGSLCDVKCDYVHHGGVIGSAWVEGTDWSFESSMEGEVSYPFVYGAFHYVVVTLMLIVRWKALLSSVAYW
jgi:hypothetical protein